MKHLFLVVCLLGAACRGNPEPEDSSGVLWLPDKITSEVRRDESAMKMGQYLQLTQALPDETTGWAGIKIDLPDDWKIAAAEMIDGLIVVRTATGQVFKLGPKNMGELSFAILNGGVTDDDGLARLWKTHAGAENGPSTFR